MDTAGKKLRVFVNGRQSGLQWDDVPLIIDAVWNAGTDEEKFEVLAAIRLASPPAKGRVFRCADGRTPCQVGRSDGFKELSYGRSACSVAHVVIVPPLMTHLRMVPEPHRVPDARRTVRYEFSAGLAGSVSASAD